MTDNDDLQQRREAAYTERGEQLGLRACLMDGAEAAGVKPGDSLPHPLRAAHASYSRRITQLNAEIADLDQQIANEKE